MKGNGGKLIAHLFQLQCSIKLLHWQTESYAVHVASDKLVHSIVDLSDALIEQYIGLYGRPRLSPGTCKIALTNMTTERGVRILKDAIAFLSSNVPRQPPLLALRDELMGSISEALYLFTLK